jgi:hypothetical protein
MVIETCVIVEQVGVLRAVNVQESDPNRFDSHRPTGTVLVCDERFCLFALSPARRSSKEPISDQLS